MGLIGKRYKQGGYVDSRYYKPMLEEFHVGFEYEAYCFKVDVCQIPDDIEIDEYFKNYDKYPQVNRIDTGWKKSIVGNGLFETTEDIPVLLRNDAARVKYLDKSDIEDLGWKLNGRGSHYNKEFEGDGAEHQLYYQEDNHFLQIYNWNSEIIFQGTIKNKSELKVLLNQLGIL